MQMQTAHLARVNLKNADASFWARGREFDLSVDTSRAKKCRIQYIYDGHLQKATNAL